MCLGLFKQQHLAGLSTPQQEHRGRVTSAINVVQRHAVDRTCPSRRGNHAQASCISVSENTLPKPLARRPRSTLRTPSTETASCARGYGTRRGKSCGERRDEQCGCGNEESGPAKNQKFFCVF